MNLDNKQKIAINAEDSNIVLLSGAGVGKSCPNSTKIPTPKGWTTVGEVKVGDYLFDRNGNPTKVLGVYPQGEREVYEITFRDKRKARCSIDHIWTVHKSTWKDKNDFRDYTLKQILEDEWVIEDERGYKSYLFSIPCSKVVKYENNKKLKVNPYLFGVFLGDGCCQEQDLTLFSSEEELIKRVQKILNSPQLYKEQSSYSWTFYKDLNNNRFKTKEIFGEYKESICCRSYEKSIPDDFKYSSIEDRYELIRGLMDTDGIITRARGEYHVRFSTISPKLRDDFIEVMGSLGYVCSYETNKRSDKYTLREAYEIIINIPNAGKHKLFSLSEKKEIALECKDRKQNQNFDRTTIINIEKLDYKEEMTCFYVDNDEHLFLINNFLCTHNTTVLTERVKFLRNKGVPAKDIVCISFSNLAAEEIRSRLDDEVCKEMFIGTIHSYANYILKTNGIDLSIDINMGKFDKILEKALTLPKRKFIKVKHLLIDEFQDTGDKEWEFIQHIPYENIYVLGDERQCIYRFNGCTDQYLKDCYYNPNFTTYYLNTNYRCSPNFVSFADEIVASLDKISPPTEVARKSNGVFEKTSFLNALEECQWQGNYRQWAILCRTNAEIESVSEILAEKKIPFVTFKNSELSFQEKQELLKKDAIKLLTIHTSKGSTFDHVIVVGAKLFNVEERCISYVAATRAKYTLFWCPQFKKKRNQPKTSPSTTKKMTQKTGVKMVQF